MNYLQAPSRSFTSALGVLALVGALVFIAAFGAQFLKAAGPTTLTLNKVVVNDDGGNPDTSTPDFWELVAVGPDAISGQGPTVGPESVAPGNYFLGESACPDPNDVPNCFAPAGYAPSVWVCSGGSHVFDETSGTIQIDEEEQVSCTITNDDIAPTLKLVKAVDGGGTALPGDWTLTATAGEPTDFSDSGDPGVAASHSIKANVFYTVTENALTDYVQTNFDCDTGNVVGNTINLDVGRNATCTVTNTYTPGGGGEKITPTISVTNSPLVYNSSPQAAAITSSTAGAVSDIKYNGSSVTPTNASTYAVTADFTPSDTDTYNSLDDGPAGDFVILQRSLEITPTAGQFKVYGSFDPTLSYSITAGALQGSDVLTGALARSAGENAGVYAINQGSLTAGINYIIDVLLENFTIEKANADCVISGYTGVYDTASHGATGSCTGVGGFLNILSGLVLGASFSDVPGGTAHWTFSNANYNDQSGDAAIVIGQAPSVTTVTCPSSVSYNGSAQTPCSVSVSGVGGLNLTPAANYSDNTNAGTATASYTFTGDTNHAGSSDSKNFTINKADQTITFSALSNKVFGDPDFAVSASASSGLTVSFSASGNCTVSGSTVHLTAAGTCTITASQGGSGNYNPAANVPQSFSISPAAPPSCSDPLPAGWTLVQGTSGNNTVTIGPNTKFVGNGGNDKVTASTGDHIICMGNGNDTINAGDGKDVIDAGGGNNTITAGNGSNFIIAENGNDQITAGTGDDTIDAGGGNNTVDAGAGNNNILTENGNDQITTGAGIDTVDAGGGNNTLNLGGGNNMVVAENGNDNLTTGAGTDDINLGGGNNTVNAGDGNNTILTENGNDNVVTGSGVDHIVVGGGNNTVSSGGNNDTITAGNGNDNVNGGAGTDSCTLGGGNNTAQNCES